MTRFLPLLHPVISFLPCGFLVSALHCYGEAIGLHTYFFYRLARSSTSGSVSTLIKRLAFVADYYEDLELTMEVQVQAPMQVLTVTKPRGLSLRYPTTLILINL